MKSDIFRIQNFDAGRDIFKEGDTAYSAFLVKSGVVEVTKLHETGEPEVVGYAGPGQVFGEGVLMSKMRRYNSARAHEASVCIAIDYKKLVAALERSDPFIKALFNLLSGNMQSMIDKGANIECLLDDLSAFENEEV